MNKPLRFARNVLWRCYKNPGLTILSLVSFFGTAIQVPLAFSPTLIPPSASPFDATLMQIALVIGLIVYASFLVASLWLVYNWLREEWREA